MIRPIFVTFMPLMAAFTAPAMAQMAQEGAAPACTAPAVLPPALAGWAQPHKQVKAAAKPGAIKDAALPLGAAADATLAPTPSITFAVNPEKPGGSVSHGGLFAFTLPEAGTYRVALSTGAWIDVIDGGKAAVSTAHGRGPDCSGVRKMVDYQLKAGSYVLQVSANGSPALSLMVTKLP